jgi:REP element-mobilizing transposase RayT
VKYNPDKHHRRTIRLQGYDYTASGAYFVTICTHQRQCLFGEIVGGEMRLNVLGHLIHANWQHLPHHFPSLILDAFVVMPNHIHGILVLTNPPDRHTTSRRGAALGQDSQNSIADSPPNATPNPPDHCEPGVAFGQEIVINGQEQLPNAAPLRPRLVSGSVGAIALNFKSVTT